MLILIAESKTMKTEERPVTPQSWSMHAPADEKRAERIMDTLADLTVPELASRLKLSGSLAVKMHKMVYEFKNKALGIEAIDAYTGVVFKALRFDELSAAAKRECIEDVRIISSLYGFLRPDDIIKPYRLDFTAKGEWGGSGVEKTLAAFWKQYATIQLVNKLNDGNYTEILDLLPGDAGKCIDWKITKRFAKVWKVDFVELQEGGVRKTPNAGKLKTMRGELLRQILEEGVKTVAEVKQLASDHYVCEGTPVYPDHLSFLC